MKLFYFLFLFLVVPLVVAECLTFQESLYFCQDLDNAQAECDLYLNCTQEHVIKDTCENTPACQTILCASNCEQMPASRCSAGPVPDPSWCEIGCCRFHYEGGNYCTLEQTRAACEISATNFGVERYNYDTSMNPLTCSQFCNTAGALKTDVTKELPKQSVGLQSTSTQTISMQDHVNPKGDTQKSAFNIGVLIGFLILICILVLIYKNFAKLTSFLSKQDEVAPKDPIQQEQSMDLEIPLVAPPPTKHYEEKVKEHQREDILAEFGGDDITPSAQFHKLANMAKYHQKRKNIPFEQLKTATKQQEQHKEETALEKLKKLTKK